MRLRLVDLTSVWGVAIPGKMNVNLAPDKELLRITKRCMAVTTNLELKPICSRMGTCGRERSLRSLG